MPPAWRRSLAHRPLISIAIAVAAGAAAGPYYAAVLQGSTSSLTRNQPVLGLPLAGGLLLLLAALALRRRWPGINTLMLLMSKKHAGALHESNNRTTCRCG